MDLSGTAGDAWGILANVGGKRGHPGSCEQELHQITGGASTGISITTDCTDGRMIHRSINMTYHKTIQVQ
jgi:hypothetical protein